MSKKVVKQQQWLRDLIPDEFCDLDYLFEAVLFEGLIFFWEQDGGAESLEFNSKPWPDDGFMMWSEARKDCYDAMKAAYEWGKTREESEPKAPGWKGKGLLPNWNDAEYQEASQAYHAAKAKWEDEKDTHVTNIIKYRKYLWT